MGTWVFVTAAAFLAGFVDALVGGGGLVQLPALFAGFPQAAPATLLGTNKLGSICGTTAAALRYRRVVRLPWAMLLPALLCAFAAAICGSSMVSLVSPKVFRPLVPLMLLLVLIYVGLNPNIGKNHAPVVLSRRRRIIALSAIGCIGFYDGFFGPGTGSFLMLLFVRLYGFDFLNASAGARTVNIATNAAALLVFGLQGEVQWGLGLVLGASNAAGGVLGAHTAIKHGSRFVRTVFIIVVLGLATKTGFDALR